MSCAAEPFNPEDDQKTYDCEQDTVKGVGVGFLTVNDNIVVVR